MRILSFWAFLALLLTVAGLSSCKKMAHDAYQQNTPANKPAYVKVVHAAPVTGALDVAFDQDRLGMNFFTYTNHTNYIGVTTGVNVFSVFEAGLKKALVVKNLSFEASKNYSVFIADTASKMDAVLIRDSSRAPGTDSVRIRFVNMSPDAGSLDLYIKGEKSPLASGISYKAAGNFMSLKAANDVVFELRRAGREDVLATSASINLLTGNFYTLWSTGFLSMRVESGIIRVEAIRH